MLPERRLLTRKLNVLKCKGKTSRLACVTMRVFVEANLRLLVMGPGETSILHCVLSFQGQTWNMQPQCYSQVKHFSFKITPVEEIMPSKHECGIF